MKNTQKHTEEPWGLDRNGFIRLSEQLEFCREEIGTENEWVPIITLDEEGTSGVVALTHPINAPLVAAAPDLLAALRFVALADDEGKLSITGATGTRALQAVRAAISKAEGVK